MQTGQSGGSAMSRLVMGFVSCCSSAAILIVAIWGMKLPKALIGFGNIGSMIWQNHLEQTEKLRLQELVKQGTGIRLSGLSGLYCYFLLLAHAWVAEGGVACWLVPSEFMDVRYGTQIKHYPKPLLQQLLTDNPLLIRRVWQALNTIDPAQLKGEGRIYGGGLHKIEPRELANTSAETLLPLFPTMDTVAAQQLSLF